MNILLDSTSSSSSSDDEYVRRPKRYKKRKNYVEIYDDLDFFERFRLTKETFSTVLLQIQDRLQSVTRKGGKTANENLYESIIRTRNVVERQYGVWKTTLTVIIATAVLHNIALRQNEDMLDEWTIPIEEEDNAREEDAAPLDNLARHNIINEHFGRL
ncbi:hypothetical protein RN001_006043 [Aquatica leii]|uniref:DDE Tnp4 domain-containing protein n=1 Tax=Aquatica leii TaxID=1421715 RepID=A0AAN7Q183_9COLE|nr:hypothetical protein RN001_006043 [Aquatica leii]